MCLIRGSLFGYENPSRVSSRVVCELVANNHIIADYTVLGINLVGFCKHKLTKNVARSTNKCRRRWGAVEKYTRNYTCSV